MLAKNAYAPIGDIILPRVRYIRAQGILTSVEVTLEVDDSIKTQPEVLDRFFGGTFRMERRQYQGRVVSTACAMRCYIHHIDELIKWLLERDFLSAQDHLRIAQLVSAGLAITRPTRRLIERYDWLAADFEDGPMIPPNTWHAMVAMIPSTPPLVAEESIALSEPMTVRMPTSPPKDVYRDKQPSQTADRPHPPRKPSPSSSGL